MRRKYRHRRAEDLTAALYSKKQTKSNGNHTVTVQDCVANDFPKLMREVCLNCEMSLICLQQGYPPDVREAKEKMYPCFRNRGRIVFQYHGSACTILETRSESGYRLTDNGMYGYSVTTSKNIRQYFEALTEHGFFSADRIDDLIKIFKKHRHEKKELWVEV